MELKESKGLAVIQQWLDAKGMSPFVFQQQTWQHILNGESGLVNAPTGCGKTFSVFLGAVIDFINQHPDDYRSKKKNGLQLLWITPLRALAKDIGRAMNEVIAELGMTWTIGIRNGDTTMQERQRQKNHLPEVLIITPESLHLLLAQKNYPEIFQTLKLIAVDEWHELLGSKRGVQVELAISRIVSVVNSLSRVKTGSTVENDLTTPNSQPDSDRGQTPAPPLSIWGISATIGNLEQAKEVLLSSLGTQNKSKNKKHVIVSANMQKRIEIESIFPDEIEKYPWAGHLGIKLVDKVIPVIRNSKTTLIFINTRGMSETWYQSILTAAP
ncbi:MAG: ligase-associated damage response box helicase, partial [Chitinophagaceae bacterium]|nr:ligase-associated damage response box helicase [Chitinophagaceae bacterium]